MIRLELYQTLMGDDKFWAIHAEDSKEYSWLLNHFNPSVRSVIGSAIILCEQKELQECDIVDIANDVEGADFHIEIGSAGEVGFEGTDEWE